MSRTPIGYGTHHSGKHHPVYARTGVTHVRYPSGPLTYSERKHLPSHAFVFPSRRAYPIYNEAHARNALARVSEHGSEYEKRKVCEAVRHRFPEIHLHHCTIHSGHLTEHHSPTVVSKHIVAIAKGKASPKTVAEARAVILYMDELRAERLKKELETKRALLAYERGTGTTAGIKRAFKNLPTTSRLASVEAERKARRKIGLAIQRGLRFRF